MSGIHHRWGFIVLMLVAVVLAAACQPSATPTPTPIPTSTTVPTTAATTEVTAASTVAATSEAVTIGTEAASAEATGASTAIIVAPTEAVTSASTEAATSASTLAVTAGTTAESTSASTEAAVVPTTAASTAEATAGATAASTSEAVTLPAPTEAVTSEATAAATTSLGNIIDVAKADGHFTTLLSALDKADLTDTLEGAGPFTVFAPTDDAFKALLTATNMTADDLLKDTDLANILKYHVAPGKITTDDLQQYRSADNPNSIVIPTMDGDNKLTLTFNVVSGAIVINGTAKVTLTNVQADNGVIYVIDTVLMPPSASATETATVESTAAATAEATAVPTIAPVSFGPIEGTAVPPTPTSAS